MDEITLKGGSVVRYEVVPFTMGFDLMNKVPELRYPDEPVVVIKTKVGSETKPAAKDSTEWKEYEVARNRIDETRGAFGQYLPWQEGVVEWKLAGSDEWQAQPPDDYKMPRMIEAMGGFAPLLDNRRIAYIRYIVCKDIRDVTQLTQALLSGLPITTEEVDAAVEGFPGETPRESDEKPARKRSRV